MTADTCSPSPTRRRIVMMVAILLLAAPMAGAQSLASTPATGAAGTPEAPPVQARTWDAQAAAVPPTRVQPAHPQERSGFARWVDVQAGTVTMRYRYVQTSAGVVAADHVQSQAVLRGRFKFDRAGRVSVNVLAASGNSFTGSWNDTGWGTGERAWNFSVKHLFINVVPVKGVDVSFGSFAPLRGESTEITTFDNDGYLTGERVTVKRPAKLYFDELGFTSAYLGDVLEPSVFDRSERLGEARNYFQYFAAKRFNKRLAVSGDYTRQSGTFIVHAAVTAVVATPVVDTLKYEQYVRGGDDDAAGFGVYGEKVITNWLALVVGYATIDEHYGGLNADRFNRGDRLYESATIKFTPELSLMAWTTQAVATDYRIANKYRFDAVLTYNVLGGLQRAGWLK